VDHRLVAPSHVTFLLLDKPASEPKVVTSLSEDELTDSKGGRRRGEEKGSNFSFSDLFSK
jgi:hypothetical protein